MIGIWDINFGLVNISLHGKSYLPLEDLVSLPYKDYLINFY
jgi:hypothetical protein